MHLHFLNLALRFINYLDFFFYAHLLGIMTKSE